MINNKQVNLWRGTDSPPTIYHVWIYNNQKILLFNGEEWVTFVDDYETVNKLLALQKEVKRIDENVDKLLSSTINSIPITDNPVLSGKDLLLKENGHFIESNNTISESVQVLDSMFHTLIIE